MGYRLVGQLHGAGTFVFGDDQVLARSLRRRGLARPGPLTLGWTLTLAGVCSPRPDGQQSGCGRWGRSAKANCSKAQPCLRSGHRRITLR